MLHSDINTTIQAFGPCRYLHPLQLMNLQKVSEYCPAILLGPVALRARDRDVPSSATDVSLYRLYGGR